MPLSDTIKSLYFSHFLSFLRKNENPLLTEKYDPPRGVSPRRSGPLRRRFGGGTGSEM
ncbi:hypothetical protein ACUXPF_003616, partial [Sphingomonas sanguinis]